MLLLISRLADQRLELAENDSSQKGQCSKSQRIGTNYER